MYHSIKTAAESGKEPKMESYNDEYGAEYSCLLYTSDAADE